MGCAGRVLWAHAVFPHASGRAVTRRPSLGQRDAERIKNFPLLRLFTGILPFGLLDAFHGGHSFAVWMVGPFIGIVSWAFLTMNKIGEWSENPFEGLHNDVPISQMSRCIERDILQMLDEVELPAERTARSDILF